MIVYRDILTGDEVLSDAFKLEEVKDADGVVVRLIVSCKFSIVKLVSTALQVEGLMCCQSKLITKSDDVDVGCGNEFGGGSEEEAGGGSTVQQVNNVIDGFQYTETQIGTASDFKSWIKEYMNLVVAKLREKGAKCIFIITVFLKIPIIQASRRK